MITFPRRPHAFVGNCGHAHVPVFAHYCKPTCLAKRRPRRDIYSFGLRPQRRQPRNPLMNQLSSGQAPGEPAGKCAFPPRE